MYRCDACNNVSKNYRSICCSNSFLDIKFIAIPPKNNKTEMVIKTCEQNSQRKTHKIF